jgi:hypothetical protein
MKAGGLTPKNLIHPTISLEMPVPSTSPCSRKFKEKNAKALVHK